MTRQHAWAPRGKRAHGTVPRNRGIVTTIVGALTRAGLQALMTTQGGTTAAVFRRFVDEHLKPLLRPGDVVVMDNLAAHHATGIREAIESTGARVLYMPPYSPDLNPIELCWSKFKSLLQAAKARTVTALQNAIRKTQAQIRASDAAAWIGHVFAHLN